MLDDGKWAHNCNPIEVFCLPVDTWRSLMHHCNFMVLKFSTGQISYYGYCYLSFMEYLLYISWVRGCLVQEPWLFLGSVGSCCEFTGPKLLVCFVERPLPRYLSISASCILTSWSDRSLSRSCEELSCHIYSFFIECFEQCMRHSEWRLWDSDVAWP